MNADRDHRAMEALRGHGCDDQFRMSYDGYSFCVSFRAGFAIHNDPAEAILEAARRVAQFHRTGES